MYYVDMGRFVSTKTKHLPTWQYLRFASKQWLRSGDHLHNIRFRGKELR